MIVHASKKLVRRVAGRSALVMPVDRGPRPLKTLVARARAFEARRLLRTGDLDRAERAVQPLVRAEVEAARAWVVIAEARDRRGDLAGSLAAARHATGEAEPGLDALHVHHRLAGRAGEAMEAAETIRRMVGTRPRNRREIRLVLEALREGTDDDLRAYARSLRQWGFQGYEDHIEHIATERRLIELHESDRTSFVSELRSVWQEARTPATVIVRALVRCRAWAELAQFVSGDLSGDPSAQSVLPIGELRHAATRAMKDGHTSAAVVLANAVLSVRPTDAAARRVLEDGSDQLAVVANGWAPATRGSTPYEPRPRAALSVLSQSLPIMSGGYATRSHGILTQIAARGWDVAAVTRLGFPYDRWDSTDTRVVPMMEIVDGIPYYRLLDDGVRSYPQYPLASYVEHFADRLVEHAIKHQASLIHAASFYVTGLAAANAARILGLPFIYEMRGLEELIKVSRNPSFLHSDRHQFLTLVEREVCLQADRVFVITDALRREMASRGVPKDRLIVLPNGVDVAKFVPRERNRELENALDLQGKTVIGYAGGLVDYEGLDLLLKAAHVLKSRRLDFHILIVGDGPYQGRLHELVAQLELDERVTFVGRVPHSRVRDYLSLFDIAPFPRLPLPVCELISPMKPFEAMAMARAVVVSSVSALTEIVDDKRTGLVFAKGDVDDLVRVLELLLGSPDLRMSLGTAAHDWIVAERDWSHLVRIVDQTYRGLKERSEWWP